MQNKEIAGKQLVSRRTFIIGTAKLGLLSLLLGRMFYMQLIKKDEYKTLSDKNRISFIVISPARGRIIDATGRALVTNERSFKLLLDKNISSAYKKELALLNDILNLPLQVQVNILNKAKRADRRIAFTILESLTWSQIAMIEEHKLQLPSLFIDAGSNRHYQGGPELAHLTGYMGMINEQERGELKTGNMNDFSVGKAGLEKYYEPILRGEFGHKQMEINAHGKYVRELSHTESIPGKDLHLNIDATLQEKIYPFLNKQGCSAIVMDINNGNIPVLMATPAFVANNFNRLEYWQGLIADPYKPLINKTLQNNYPPGSVFKLITILAALEAGVTPARLVTCTGASALGTNSFRCHSRRGHGTLDMYGAIKYSCNTYMYEMGRIMGPDKILDMAKRFGFGFPTSIDLPGEVAGFVPSRKWKREKLKSEWSLGDTLNLTIGQGFLLATPIQMARFVAAIANGGKLFTPRIVKNKPLFTQIDINPEYLDIIKKAMHQAVNVPGGTAYYSRILHPDFQLAGKTGTAQVQGKTHAGDDLNRESIAWERRNHAVFIGFGPYHAPAYAVTVFVDHGGGGGRAAAPIARHIMTELLNLFGNSTPNII